MTNEPGENDRLLLQALADRELDAATALAMEQKIARDPALAEDYARIVATKAAVGGLEKPAVTEDFYARIAALGAPPAAAPSNVVRPSRWGRSVHDWQAIAASVVVTACIASGATYSIMSDRGGGAPSIEDAVAAGHRRSLLASSPIDVASSDRHTVRPWFDAKLGFAPPTTDLSAQGFQLVGGRVDIVRGRAMPSLVYRRGAHLISVLAMPATQGEATSSPPVAMEDAGYNMVRWTKDGFRYWAASDLDAKDLSQFVGDLVAK